MKKLLFILYEFVSLDYNHFSMTGKPLLNHAVVIDLPLERLGEIAWKIDEPPPPPYQHPQIDFNSGWKDRGFAIIFWIQTVAVIVIGLVLGIPVLIPYGKHHISNRQERTTFD